MTGSMSIGSAFVSDSPPPRERSPESNAPFSTEGRPKRLDVGAVYRSALRHRTRLGRCIPQLDPEALSGPSVKAVYNLQGMRDARNYPPLSTMRTSPSDNGSSTRRAPGWFLGRCGSITAQASSDNQNNLIAHILRRTPTVNQEENLRARY